MDEGIKCSNCGSKSYWYLGAGTVRCQRCLAEMQYRIDGNYYKRTWDKSTGGYTDWILIHFVK